MNKFFVVVSILVLVPAQTLHRAIPKTRQEPTPDFGSMIIDEYGDVSAKEEAKRLDEFVKHLEPYADTEVYLIGFGGRESWPGEAKDRANCAKQYLVKAHKIIESRIVVVDGGYEPTPRLSLYIRMLTAKPPKPYPTLDASQVEILDSKRRKQFRSKCHQLLKRI
jgi:hypothetical protein